VEEARVVSFEVEVRGEVMGLVRRLTWGFL
jgi:hypothetical protein